MLLYMLQSNLSINCRFNLPGISNQDHNNLVGHCNTEQFELI